MITMTFVLKNRSKTLTNASMEDCVKAFVSEYEEAENEIESIRLDQIDGKNISGQFWKDLHACRYVHKQNTNKLVVALRISDEHDFVKTCMKEYGYTVLR